MPDPEIKKGIPLRVGATRCVLGTLRDDPEVVEATETLIDHENVTGCSPRNPQHGVKYTNDENSEPRYTAMTPYSTYPKKLEKSTDDEATHLVIKARGQLKRAEDGAWLFPKIKLTLRPLSTKLDYKWISDAVAESNIDSVTDFGGGYEEDVYGESVWMNFDYLYAYQAQTLDYTAEDFNEKYEVERSNLEASYIERGLPIYLQGDFFYKAEDMPDGVGQEYAPPLKPWEIDLTLYPRAEGETKYDFKMNESWDLRYRYPSWFPAYGGTPYWTVSDQFPQGRWIFTPNPAILPSENPFVKPADGVGYSIYSNGIPNHLVPVEKYIRIQEGSVASFPLETPSSDSANSSQPQIWKLHNPKHLQVVTKIRKRYPFSFNAQANAAYSSDFQVFDNNPANVFYYEPDPINEPSVFQAYTVSGSQVFRGTDPEYYPDALDGVEKYNCESWWRMEIETEACEWNFDEILNRGWTIKGKIKFAKKFLDRFSTPNGAVKGGGTFQYFSGTGTVSATEGVYQTASFGFFRPEDTEWDAEAGEQEFTVKISKDNAIGSPVLVLDFPIGGKSYIPNAEGDGLTPVQWGDPPELSINFIQDFFITEIIPPEDG